MLEGHVGVAASPWACMVCCPSLVVCCIGLSVLWRFGGKWQQRVTPVGLCHGLPATFLGSVSCASSRLEWRGALCTTLLGCFVLKNCVDGGGLITRSPKRTGPRRLQLHRHRCSIFQQHTRPEASSFFQAPPHHSPRTPEMLGRGSFTPPGYLPMTPPHHIPRTSPGSPPTDDLSVSHSSHSRDAGSVEGPARQLDLYGCRLVSALLRCLLVYYYLHSRDSARSGPHGESLS